MITARAILIAALLAVSGVAQAQVEMGDDVPPELRSAVTAYRSGDLRAAEVQLRSLAPGNPDAEAWLGAVLLDRGDSKQALRLFQRSAGGAFTTTDLFETLLAPLSGCEQPSRFRF